MSTTPNPAQPQPELDYYFTFGFNSPYAKRFVKLRGTASSARAAMFDRFGNKWAFQYDSPEKAGVERYSLTELA